MALIKYLRSSDHSFETHDKGRSLDLILRKRTISIFIMFDAG